MTGLIFNRVNNGANESWRRGESWDPESPPDSGSKNFFRFLRDGHVLSALLREILEEKFLGDLELHSLTRAQFCFFKLIALNAGLKIGEVARCVGVSPSACTKHVDKLEGLGLVCREHSP